MYLFALPPLPTEDTPLRMEGDVPWSTVFETIAEGRRISFLCWSISNLSGYSEPFISYNQSDRMKDFIEGLLGYMADGRFQLTLIGYIHNKMEAQGVDPNELPNADSDMPAIRKQWALALASKFREFEGAQQ